MILTVRTGELEAWRHHEQRIAGDLMPGPGGPHTKRALLHEVHRVALRLLPLRIMVDRAGRMVETPEGNRIRVDQLNEAIH